MDLAKTRARTTKVSRYLDANPRATMADVARLVTIHEGLSKADVDAWTVFTTTPPEEIIDAAVAFKELGVLGDKAKNSDLVKRELWFLSNVGVKTSTKGQKKHYNVSALSMTCVILALPEEHKARCTLVAIKMAFRTFLTRQEKEKRQAEPTIEHPTKKRTQSEPAAPLESPVAKRIKTNLAPTPQTPTKTEIKAEGTEDAFMYLTPPHPTNQTKTKKKPAASSTMCKAPPVPVTPEPTPKMVDRPKWPTQRSVTFMHASPYVVDFLEGEPTLCPQSDADAEYDAVVAGLRHVGARSMLRMFRLIRFVVLAKSAHDNAPYDARWCRQVLMFFVAVAVRPVVATRTSLIRAEKDGCTVMHFSGHGTTDAALLFEFDDLSGDLVYVEQLAKFFQSAPPRLVVLLACHSEKMAPAFLAAGVKHVIAVSSNWAMAEDAVNVFARSLYTMLGRGCGIDEGFNVATFDEADHFVLLPRGADHSAVIFPEAFDDSDVLPGDPFPPLRADYLPKEVREYKERQLDEGDICSRLASRKVHVAWLHGPSNVGKTQLACSAARALQLTPVFARGVTFISVEDIAETCPGVANDAVLNALKLQVDAWLAATADRSSEPQAATLIVLDGVDALVASRTFVLWLDKICRSKTFVHFLVTSRAITSHVGAFKHPSGLNPIKIVCHTTLASDTSCRRRIDLLNGFGANIHDASVKNEAF